jgi:hypothetical protein
MKLIIAAGLAFCSVISAYKSNWVAAIGFFTMLLLVRCTKRDKACLR